MSVYHVSKSTITLLYDLPPQTPKIIAACDCPCDDLVEVETPSRIAMALSYIAQALVVTIVGLNMGFRWCVGVSYMRGADGWGRSYRCCEVRLKLILL